MHIGFKKNLSEKKAFSLEQINKYYKNYGYNYYYADGTNLQFDEYKARLEHLWYLKVAFQTSDTKSGASYAERLSFDSNQIRLYIADKFETKQDLIKWAQESKENQTVMVEWAAMLKNNEHTDFYKENETSIKNALKNPNNKFVNTNTNDVAQSVNKLQTQWQNDRNVAAEKLQDAVEQIMAGKAESMTAMTEEEVNERADEALSEDEKYDKDKDTVFLQPVGSGAASNGVKDALSDADSFVQSGDQGVVSTENLQSFSQNLYSILLAIGVVIAVIMGTILGVKLMVAPIEERVEAKKLLVPYVVGCVIVFGAFGIWKLVVTIMQGL